MKRIFHCYNRETGVASNYGLLYDCWGCRMASDPVYQTKTVSVSLIYSRILRTSRGELITNMMYKAHTDCMVKCWQSMVSHGGIRLVKEDLCLSLKEQALQAQMVCALSKGSCPWPEMSISRICPQRRRPSAGNIHQPRCPSTRNIHQSEMTINRRCPSTGDVHQPEMSINRRCPSTVNVDQLKMSINQKYPSNRADQQLKMSINWRCPSTKDVHQSETSTWIMALTTKWSWFPKWKSKRKREFSGFLQHRNGNLSVSKREFCFWKYWTRCQIRNLENFHWARW